ncbi:HK97-gp10 family putative phage morphogenesis protein [Kribbella deserti]|uniref:HK97-gp10 family putative phage morphogenesis protein n=1 Tax=Kribbella deserti TaxID=1926257 RepID=A0ABV6QF22_9ACTN
MGFDITEIRRLKSDLGNASIRATMLASKAIAKTAHDIEAAAKVLAPVDTGNLRNSISSDVSVLSAEIGPTVEYGAYVEFGTSRMGPQPYLNPALYRHIPSFNAAMSKIADL